MLNPLRARNSAHTLWRWKNEAKEKPLGSGNVFFLVVAAVFPSTFVAGMSTAASDRNEYTGHATWYSASNTITRYEDTIRGGYVQDVKVSIPWDGHVAASVSILAHHLYFIDDDGKIYDFPIAVGATDYNRGTQSTISYPGGTTTKEKYSVSFVNDGYSKHVIYSGTTSGESRGGVIVKVTATDEVSAKMKAEAKVKAGLDVLGSGWETALELSSEVVKKVSGTQEYYVEVSFTLKHYYLEVDYKGYLVHEVTTYGNGPACPTLAPNLPEISKNSVISPLGCVYSKVNTKPFDLSRIVYFWSFAGGVDISSLGANQGFPIVYEEVSE
ncbi:Hypothetical protein TAM4_207 [Thermococcus sp. AM4]|nr:Hypothetical protein TAM4_207 [Thermococcus sp. AM4]